MYVDGDCNTNQVAVVVVLPPAPGQSLGQVLALTHPLIARSAKSQQAVEIQAVSWATHHAHMLLAGSPLQVVVLPDNTGALHTICSPITPSGNAARASVMRAHEWTNGLLAIPGRPPLLAHCPGSGRQPPDYFARVPCATPAIRRQELPAVPPVNSLAQLQHSMAPHCPCRAVDGHHLYVWHAEDCPKRSHTLAPVSLFHMHVWVQGPYAC